MTTNRILIPLALLSGAALAVLQFVVLFFPFYPAVDAVLYFLVGLAVAKWLGPRSSSFLAALLPLPCAAIIACIYAAGKNLARGVGLFHPVALAVVPIASWIGLLVGNRRRDAQANTN